MRHVLLKQDWDLILWRSIWSWVIILKLLPRIGPILGNGVYDAKIAITGGSSTAGTGDMDFDVNTAAVNGNIIWHAGNLGVSTGIGSGNVYDTNSNGDAVLRSSNGDFASRYIYATGTPGGDEVGFKGTASGNLALSGGTMSGNITFNQDEGGIVFARNTDGASILFYNDSDADTNSRLEFNINDNGNEFFRWTGTQGGTVKSLS